MGGGALIEGDEFVGFLPREAPTPAQQGVEPVPFVAVGGCEDVEVHGRCSWLAGEVPAWQKGHTGRSGSGVGRRRVPA